MFHDDDAEVYFDGVLAAKVASYNVGYEETPIAPEALAVLQPGKKIVIAVHCHQTNRRAVHRRRPERDPAGGAGVPRRLFRQDAAGLGGDRQDRPGAARADGADEAGRGARRAAARRHGDARPRFVGRPDGFVPRRVGDAVHVHRRRRPVGVPAGGAGRDPAEFVAQALVDRRCAGREARDGRAEPEGRAGKNDSRDLPGRR